MTIAQTEIIHSYRHLFRGLLRAVRYSKPARGTVRDQLRDAFRKGTIADLDLEKIARTVQFFKHAEEERGLEHKIVKNLLHAEFARRFNKASQISPREMVAHHLSATSHTHYKMTIAMLNESMGLCLR